MVLVNTNSLVAFLSWDRSVEVLISDLTIALASVFAFLETALACGSGAIAPPVFFFDSDDIGRLTAAF